MSRRRSTVQQQQQQQELVVDNSEQNQQEHSNAISRCQPASSMFAQLRSWRERASSWLSVELGRIFVVDDKPAHESNKILAPSLVSFVLGLLLVKVYGDTLDSAIVRCYEHLKGAFDTFAGLLGRLSAKDIEAVAVLCVLVLFWIGALRILVNLVRRLVQIPRLH